MSDVKLIKYDAACKAIADARFGTKRHRPVRSVRLTTMTHTQPWPRCTECKAPADTALLDRPRAPKLRQGGGDNLHGGGKRGGGDGGSGRLCPRCGRNTVGRLPLFFREDGDPICVICGTDRILGWDTFGLGA